MIRATSPTDRSSRSIEATAPPAAVLEAPASRRRARGPWRTRLRLDQADPRLVAEELSGTGLRLSRYTMAQGLRTEIAGPAHADTATRSPASCTISIASSVYGVPGGARAGRPSGSRAGDLELALLVDFALVWLVSRVLQNPSDHFGRPPLPVRPSFARKVTLPRK